MIEATKENRKINKTASEEMTAIEYEKQVVEATCNKKGDLTSDVNDNNNELANWVLCGRRFQKLGHSS